MSFIGKKWVFIRRHRKRAVLNSGFLLIWTFFFGRLIFSNPWRRRLGFPPSMESI
ncbi:hypothetical protein M6B38_343150 [Iris pallida]|uniref:Uncharacterized protein n=1 Tax=Iris pallida TaxID=29817 RepID=A0AAX6GV68_IRIPA|nr:hypothetical protein M6B38_343150 [Iris pallida]